MPVFCSDKRLKNISTSFTAAASFNSRIFLMAGLMMPCAAAVKMMTMIIMMALAVGGGLMKQTQIGHLSGRGAKCSQKNVASMQHDRTSLSSKLKKKTTQNRTSELRKLAASMSLSHMVVGSVFSKQGLPVRKENDAADRVWALKTTLELTKGALLARLDSKDTWEKFEAGREGKAVFKNSVCQLEHPLTADMSLSVTNGGCYLDPGQPMPLFFASRNQG